MIKCFFENGGKASLRHVTIDAIIVKNDKILLVKRAANLINPNKYALPGGFLDRDETTRDAIAREIKEETGYECKSATLFRINDKPDRIGEDRQNVDFVFLVEVGEQVSKPDKEINELVWFELDSLPKAEEFAFDHYENVELYKSYRFKKFSLPIV